MKDETWDDLTFSIDNQKTPLHSWLKESYTKEYSSISEVTKGIEAAAQPLPSKTALISKNINLRQDSLKLDKERFANFIRLRTDDPRTINIIDNKKRKQLLAILEENTNIKAASTLTYEFLADEIEGATPQTKTYNLIVYNGQLKQLPVLNRTALIIFRSGELIPKFVKARGTLIIGNKKVPWRGSVIADDNYKGAIAYNCSSGRIEHRRGGQWFGKKRVAIFTTTPKDKNRFDLVIKGLGNHLAVENIIPGGGTDINTAGLIFSLPNRHLNQFELNKTVTVTLDDLDLSTVENAITVGPLIPQTKDLFTKQIEQEHFDNDPALSENPFGLTDPTARGAIYKSNGQYNLIIIDAIPRSKKWPGLTPFEIHELIYGNHAKIDWAVMIDPGQTLKFAARMSSQKRLLFGNMHYCKPSRRNKDKVVLNSLEGRVREYYLAFGEFKQ